MRRPVRSRSAIDREAAEIRIAQEEAAQAIGAAVVAPGPAAAVDRVGEARVAREAMPAHLVVARSDVGLPVGVIPAPGCVARQGIVEGLGGCRGGQQQTKGGCGEDRCSAHREDTPNSGAPAS